MKRGAQIPALEAFLRAVEGDRTYADNWHLARHVLLATDHPTAWEKALRVAAALPGAVGADILFQVWASTPRTTGKTTLAKELLETDGVRERASEAVRIGLDLRNVGGQGCDVRRELLPRALKHGDNRSLLPLMKMASHRGCGPRGRDDCFPCLRGDDLLERAVAACKSRPAPDYSKPPVGTDP